MFCSIVPPYLLRRLARLDDRSLLPVAEAAQRALARDAAMRRNRNVKRAQMPALPTLLPSQRIRATGLNPTRQINDAQNMERLPGIRVRSEGDGPVEDVAVNEAYDGLGSTFELFADAYQRNALDGRGGILRATVHYGEDYDNAFWNGTRMVFGDGDGRVFQRFTKSLSVIGHELTHGITQHTTNLVYQGQPGALNESISDVFAALVEQYKLRHSADHASWLIGEGLFTDQVSGDGLRSLKAPGTAYDDDVLGKDPQPATMADYIDTTDDNGGVHLNSGIPNHAFYRLASILGGNAWERAGLIWYDTITGTEVVADTDFAGFAAATESAAESRYGKDSEELKAVTAAWTEVGVLE
ncbi:M4 family metallopeptidase [Arthrobacter crystallopoietes]|uniref:Neutral metalloproteinase n=1 Tax=Crystallibacter crystallopoietes TaxID=37928 RepID=A0A1H1E9W8_9MICC|nr:M4 family metallopeptidase [Arthrobacter crystallopoietes]AUI49991.1 peptidase M4 family protein [Arthrobacter crystallopoietes]SDQ85340.1 Thermolysin metallopeptidase, catalytic domain [Arthrobacter crystallopoietes]